MVSLHKFNRGDLARIDGFGLPVGNVISEPYLDFRGETLIDVTYSECGYDFIQECLALTLFPA